MLDHGGHGGGVICQRIVKACRGVTVARAKEILGNLEKSELNTEGQPALAKSSRKRLVPDPTAAAQLPLL